MIKADSAQVSWDVQKKRWIVRVRIGEEVIKRPCRKASQSVEENELREMAIQTAKDDGYDLDSSSIAIER